MTSVFSAIPLPQGYFLSRMRAREPRRSKDRKTAGTVPATNGLEPSVASGEQQEEPDLRKLNNALEALSSLFPDVQPEVFREMLSSFQEESRLQVVVDQLLKHKAKWVQGRWRIPREHEEQPRYKYKTNTPLGVDRELLPEEDKFRSHGYKEAVKTALCHEFKGLSSSTIRAVLAEYNYSYTQARPTLLTLTSKSWRYSLTNFVMRRKTASPHSHPLVSWQPAASGDPFRLIPQLKSTLNPELDQELYMSLIFPLEAKMRREQEESDSKLAEDLNYTEAETLESLYECQCCFTPTVFEFLSTCDEDGHHICFRCISQAATEALYGQGWARNFNVEKLSFRCLAPAMDAAGECRGTIPQHFVRRALEDGEDNGAWTKLEEKAASESVIKSGLTLIRCPFCAYAEIDDIFFSDRQPWMRLRAAFIFHPAFGTFLALYVLMFPSLFAFCWLILGCALLTVSVQALALHSSAFERSRKRLARKRHGLKFICRGSLCGRASCMHCLKEWRDIHVCYESEQIALRSTIERATAEAIKRTCPKCNLSFIKSSGCNKLTCICGYQMCYICRQEIGKDGYSHFCEHFRSEPGKACTRCTKCDLYKTEDEELVIRRAAEEAEKQWIEREALSGVTHRNWSNSTSASTDRQAQLQCSGVAAIPNHIGWEELLDSVVETILEIT